MEVGKREIIYLSLHCHHQNDSCIRMDSDEGHFNVSIIVRDKVTSPYTTAFEDQRRAEADSNRGPSLSPYRWAKPAHISRKTTLFTICDENLSPLLQKEV